MCPLFEQIAALLAPPLQGLNAEQTQLRRPSHPEKWSIQQIVEHLTLTYASTRGAVEARVQKGKPTEGSPTLGQHAMQVLLIRLGVFPEGRPAPSFVVPPAMAPAMSGLELLASVRDGLSALEPCFDQAESLFGSRRAVTHQILGPLSIPQWRRFHLVHARHHAKQIIAIRRENAL